MSPTGSSLTSFAPLPLTDRHFTAPCRHLLERASSGDETSGKTNYLSFYGINSVRTTNEQIETIKSTTTSDFFKFSSADICSIHIQDQYSFRCSFFASDPLTFSYLAIMHIFMIMMISSYHCMQKKDHIFLFAVTSPVGLRSVALYI